MKYKHFIFDMDGTLTESRSQIKKEMYLALKDLMDSGADVTVISGADKKQMSFQMKGSPKDILYLCQSGNSCDYWENTLKNEYKEIIGMHIELLQRASFWKNTIDSNDLIQDRGCQISFSLIGHNAPQEIKRSFDPAGELRIALLKQFPFDHEKLIAKLGGTTCIDYTHVKGTKGMNIKRLMQLKRWETNDCVYIGDAISENGNDGTLIGIVPNLINVEGPSEALKIIKKLCK